MGINKRRPVRAKALVLNAFALTGRFLLILISFNSYFFLDFIQCLLDIIQDILYILDTYREADQVWSNACLLQLLV